MFFGISREKKLVSIAGIHVYSPIAHCHPMAIHGDLDALDRDFWLRYQESMMIRCDVLIVVEMKSWKESQGIAHEIAFFLRQKRAIFNLDPLTMTMRKMVAPGLPSALAATPKQSQNTMPGVRG